MNYLPKKYILSSIILMLVLIVSPTMALATSPAIDPGDPFGSPPKGASPNCGPEYRLKLDIVVPSKAKFIDILLNIERYIGDGEIIQWATFDSFREKDSAKIDWKALEEAVKISTVAERTIYSLEYSHYGCSPSQIFTIKIIENGHLSLYGCCGK